MNVLVIAPHRDDEIIGCGGTIAKHIEDKDIVNIVFCTKPSESMFSKEFIEKIKKESILCHDFLGVNQTFELDFDAVTLESIQKYKLNKALSCIINSTKPDIVYIPHYGDMHSDHKVVSDCAMVALRPNGTHKVKEIYSYETLSETEWNYTDATYAFIPTIWNDITDFIDIKLKAMSYYESQLYDFPHPRSLEAIEYLSKYRGSTVLVNAAECFKLIRKITE